MRKRVYTFLIVTGLLFVVFWFLIIRKSNVTNNIPAYADTIVCIDKQNIRNTILGYYFKNPSEYFSSKDSSNSFVSNTGIKLPDYFIFFTANSITKGAIFTELEVVDTNKFLDVLNHNNFERNNLYQQECFVNKTSPKLVVWKGNSKAVLSYGTDSSSLIVIKDLLGEKNILPKSDKLYQRLKSSKNHISIVVRENNYIEEQSLIGLNFLQTKIEIKGEVFNKKEYAFNGTSSLITDTNNLLNLSFNPKGLLFNEFVEAADKQSFSKKTNLNLDSLMYYFSPSVSMEINNIKTVYDTSITYGYDDNFNPIEEKTVKQKQVPNFNIELEKIDFGGFNYFVNDSIVKLIGNDYIFTPYPLQQIFVKNWDKKISLSTNKLNTVNSGLEKSTVFFNFQGNFKQGDIATIGFSEHLKKIKNFSFQLAQKQSVEVKGEIDFKNDKSHTIFVVLNMFKQ